ncbi:MAG: bifunctional riboflavin kinase/FAD synthetase [Oligoflexia bacterium]|nr:bifunctional riboflavin kinase/FAD synthetase [Oligoflexia bacterium]
METKFIDLRRASSSPKSLVLSLGGFDGIHLGHQVLIKKLVEISKKKQASSCLCLFDPLPFQVLQGEKAFKRLFTIQELGKLLKSFNLDFLCILPFDSHFAKLSAKEFIQSVLVPHFDPLHIIVGYDFSFSYQKEGNFSVLQSYGKELGFSVEQLKPCLYQGKPISSSRIRKHLSLADMKEVKALLGRAFSIQSQVLRGDGRGRKLGFPTANLKPEKKELPPLGVYSGRAQIQKDGYPAIVNIGCRPSFNGSQTFVEVHIPSFNRNLYDQILTVELGDFIRKERAFSKLSDLKEQIRQDIQVAFG